MKKKKFIRQYTRKDRLKLVANIIEQWVSPGEEIIVAGQTFKRSEIVTELKLVPFECLIQEEVVEYQNGSQKI